MTSYVAEGGRYVAKKKVPVAPRVSPHAVRFNAVQGMRARTRTPFRSASQLIARGARIGSLVGEISTNRHPAAPISTHAFKRMVLPGRFSGVKAALNIGSPSFNTARAGAGRVRRDIEKKEAMQPYVDRRIDSRHKVDKGRVSSVLELVMLIAENDLYVTREAPQPSPPDHLSPADKARWDRAARWARSMVVVAVPGR